MEFRAPTSKASSAWLSDLHSKTLLPCARSTGLPGLPPRYWAASRVVCISLLFLADKLVEEFFFNAGEASTGPGSGRCSILKPCSVDAVGSHCHTPWHAIGDVAQLKLQIRIRKSILARAGTTERKGRTTTCRNEARPGEKEGRRDELDEQGGSAQEDPGKTEGRAASGSMSAAQCTIEPKQLATMSDRRRQPQP